MQPDPTWTAGPLSTAPSEGLHQTVARTARSRPDAVALIHGGHSTTYGALDHTADAWGALLAAAGAAPGTIVPVLLPRSARLVTALLAVLKTGAAYALLDPDWPAHRLREIVDQLDPPVFVTDSAAAASGGTGAGGFGATPWTPPAGPVAPPADFRPVPVGGSDPCCVFFTSGTSGRPKGVLSPHRATARLFQAGGFARFTADTVVPLATPVAWDAFSLELWSALLNGGTSVIVSDPYLSPAALRGGIGAHQVDTVWLTASLFNMVVDEDPDAFRGLRQVMIGGERLSVPHVAAFLRQHPGVVLLNGYGPVESTVFATTHRITPADCALPGGIPLGRPVPGTQVHVLDGARHCAVDETGEICLAGDGLALRYLGEAALAEERFTPVRLDGREVRVYRTGDLGRWGEDGLLHFGGRADRQVKIRGHRVEPAEVERQVERVLPGVRSCRVIARRDAAGAARDLVAFCVPTAPGDPLSDALPVLRAALVSYQRPAAVVSVDVIPVTAQGKLDERALLARAPEPAPQPPADAGDDAGAGAEQGAGTAGAVAGAFGAVLGRDAVPRDVPFVELGGTSLQAGRVCARLAARLGRPVPVVELYRHPTVTALAGWLDSTPTPAAPTPAGPRPTTGTETAGVPLTPLQTVYLTRHLASPDDRTGHCLLTWAVEGPLDRAALESAVAAAHQRHTALRSAYLPDPRPTARPVDLAPPPLEVLPDQPSVDAAVRALRTELADDLALTDGEVWRAALVPVADPDAGRAAPATEVFGCVVHHIAFDGWSESVLAEDLAAGYRAARGSAEPQPPPPPSPAAVDHERARRLAGPEHAAHRDRLVRELADVPALRWPAVPAAAPRGPLGRAETTLPPAALAEVDAVAADAGVTRFVVLLSRWAGSLAEVTGQRDFAVGVPVAQRDGAGLERVVGCHLTMLCLRLRGVALDGGSAAVRATARLFHDALAAQDVSLADVLTRVDPPRTGRPPLYQALFALQDNATPRLDLPGLRTTFLRQPYLDLPLELHTELWPDTHGGLRLEVGFRPEAVSETTARELARRFTDRLPTASSGVSGVPR